jgi:hypothetical protein
MTSPIAIPKFEDPDTNEWVQSHISCHCVGLEGDEDSDAISFFSSCSPEVITSGQLDGYKEEEEKNLNGISSTPSEANPETINRSVNIFRFEEEK